MHYIPDISLGTITEIVTLGVLVLGASRKFGRLEQKVNIMYHWFESSVIDHKHEMDIKTKKFFGVEE